MVNQTAGSGNNNVGLLAQLLELAIHIFAADQNGSITGVWL